MELIDKAAVVAEIEKRLDEYLSSILKHYDTCTEARASELSKILVILNTLEVIDPYEQTVQYDSIKAGILDHAETYTFNIESELFNQLTKEQQILWRKEIEQAVISGGEVVKRAKIEKEKSRNLELLKFIESNFPESEDSKDEKIRKSLIRSFEIHDLRALIIPGFSAKDIIAWLEKQGEQKSSDWNEEDERRINHIITFMSDKKRIKDTETMFLIEEDVRWLKSIKPRPKNEWSGEGEGIYQSIMDDTVRENQLDGKQIDWLRNIKYRNFARPQKQWKPSGEQMKALEHFARSVGESGYASPYDQQTKLLYSLLEQLKQL